jgi:sterol 24-C-methyltransferase
MSSTGVQLNDGRIESRVENYTKFWKKDPTNEEDSDNSNRLDSYTDVVNGEQHALLRFL